MTIPFYQELAIKDVYPKLKDNAYLKLYLPDYPESVMPERSFFYTVLSTLFPRETLELVKETIKKRWLNEEQDKNELVKMTPELKEEIEHLLNFPSKCIDG